MTTATSGTTATPGTIAFELLDRFTEPHTPFPAPAPIPWAFTDWVELPVVDVPTPADAASGLAERRSHLEFADRPVSQRSLARLLAAARSLGCDLDLLVWVGNVEDLEPGLYLDTGDGRRLGHLAAPGVTDERFVEPELDRAAVVIVPVVDMSRRLAATGEHGYRRALHDGGRLATHVWLTACGDGLVGSLCTGFVPAALRELATIDGLQRVPLLSFGCGHRP